MAQPVTDDELQLRKRARRRLVGAIVLVLLVVVLLPMVLDNEPRPLAPNVVVTIPPQGSVESKFPEQPPAVPASTTAAPTASAVVGVPGSAPVGGPDARQPEPPLVPGQVAPLLPPPAASSGEVASSPPPATPPAARAGSAGKPESPPVKSTEPRKPDDTAKQETPRKPDEPRKRDDPRKPEASRKPDAPMASAAAVESPATAKSAPPATNGPWVIQLGAFSDQNNANQLVERVRALDVPGYTEAVKTSAGLKTRVRAGPFAAHDAADAARAKLLSLALAQSDLKVVRQGE